MKLPNPSSRKAKYGGESVTSNRHNYEETIEDLEIKTRLFSQSMHEEPSSLSHYCGKAPPVDHIMQKVKGDE